MQIFLRKFRGGFSASWLVPTVPQQNVTIVQRASCFRRETDSFLSASEWPGGREPRWALLLPSHVNSWGRGEARRGEARRGEAAFTLMCLSLSHRAAQRAPMIGGGGGNPRPMTCGARCQRVCSVCERTTGRTDLWHTVRWQGDGRRGGCMSNARRWLMQRNAENPCNELTTAVRWKFEEMIRN